MKKILIIPLILLVLNISATPIGEQRAREIAISFFAKSATRAISPSVELEWAGDNLVPVAGKLSTSTTNVDESLLYIYNRTDDKGHIVVAGDDSLHPIIAFSHKNFIDVDNLAPNLRFMLSSWAKQVSAARAGEYTTTRVAGDDVGEVELEYDTALWNQYAPFNNYTPLIDGKQSVTGCVATALAIICHYNRWPSYGVGTTERYEYTDDYGVNRAVNSKSLGHTYEYDDMRSDNYENRYTSEEAHAVATLMRDIGYGVKMKYHYEESGAYTNEALKGMLTYFRYSKQARLVSHKAYTESEWIEVIKANLRECGPTYFAGQRTSLEGAHSGHAFVLDGYTTGGYISINYGWGGYGNAYYLLPNIEYMEEQQAMIGLVPDRDGTSQYSDILAFIPRSDGDQITHRGLTASGEVAPGQLTTITFGGLINVASVDFDGSVRIVHVGKYGDVKSVISEYNLDLQPNYYTWGERTAYLSDTFEDGDKIVMQYRGLYSQGWQNVLRNDIECSQSIILGASADYIAEQLSVSVLKTKSYGAEVRYLVFTLPDTRDFKFMKYSIANSAGVVVSEGELKSFEESKIAANFEKGEYTVSISLGDAVYQFAVLL